jgi:hypothetical protein
LRLKTSSVSHEVGVDLKEPVELLVEARIGFVLLQGGEALVVDAGKRRVKIGDAKKPRDCICPVDPLQLGTDAIGLCLVVVCEDESLVHAGSGRGLRSGEMV